MKKIADVLLNAATKFELEVMAQGAVSTAQPADIEKVLREAGAFPMPDVLSPYLNAAKVPENVSLDIGIVVDSMLNVKFNIKTSPNNSSGVNLAKLLNSKFASSMSQAIKAAKLSVADTVQLSIATF